MGSVIRHLLQSLSGEFCLEVPWIKYIISTVKAFNKLKNKFRTAKHIL